MQLEFMWVMTARRMCVWPLRMCFFICVSNTSSVKIAHAREKFSSNSMNIVLLNDCSAPHLVRIFADLPTDTHFSPIPDEYEKNKHPNDVAKNEGLTSSAAGVTSHLRDLCVTLAVSIAGFLLLRPVPG